MNFLIHHTHLPKKTKDPFDGGNRSAGSANLKLTLSRNKQNTRQEGWLMTGRQFYDWQTTGGADDVMRLVDALERVEIPWCAIDGLAVNHWAAEPMVTRDVDLVVAVDQIDRASGIIAEAGLAAEKHKWSINFTGKSQMSIQLSTEEFYRDFPARSVPADVHGILMRVASLQDTLAGKIRAWSDPARRSSKRIKDLTDIARLIEVHSELCASLPGKVRQALDATI